MELQDLTHEGREDLKEEVLGFQEISRCVTTRYVPGTSFKPNMIKYQNIRQKNVNPMEHITWRPVELVSAHQAHCSSQKIVIYEAAQPL